MIEWALRSQQAVGAATLMNVSRRSFDRYNQAGRAMMSLINFSKTSMFVGKILTNWSLAENICIITLILKSTCNGS